MKQALGSFAASLLFVLCTTVALAQQPTISYQGLIKQNGQPVNGMQSLKVQIFDVPTGGTALYSEQQNVTVTDGIFDLAIGTVLPLMPTLDFRKQYYISVTTSDGTELGPRSQVSFVPYAFRAMMTDTAAYATRLTESGINALSGQFVSSINGQTGAIAFGNGMGTTVSNNTTKFVVNNTGVLEVRGRVGYINLVGLGGTTITDSGQTIIVQSPPVGSFITSLRNSDSTIAITNPNGPIDTLSLARMSAKTGDYLRWNGAAWRPATISGSGIIVDSLNDLKDVNDDGSSVCLGAGSGRTVAASACNVALGIDALHSDTLGRLNVAIGDSALYSNTSGGINVAIGHHALRSNVAGNGSVAIGAYSQALSKNINSGGNTSVGYTSLYANTTGGYNVAVGFGTIASNTSGSYNTAVGTSALSSDTSGSYNAALGMESLGQNASGNANVGVGACALRSNHTRSNLVAVGDSALFNNGTTSPTPPTLDSATANTAVGSRALFTNTRGSYNTATGYQALYSSTLGYNNTAVGYQALRINTTGNNNVAVGDNSGPSAANLSNTTSIGSGAQASVNNQVVLGNNSVTSLICMGAFAATTANAANLVVLANGQILRSTSSARYKTNIHDLDINTDKVYDLKPVSYTSKVDGKEYFGLVAEDVAKIIPEMAEYSEEKQVVPGSSSDKLIPDAVKYPMLSVLLLSELKKEHAKTESLEKRVEELERLVRASSLRVK